MDRLVKIGGTVYFPGKYPILGIVGEKSVYGVEYNPADRPTDDPILYEDNFNIALFRRPGGWCHVDPVNWALYKMKGVWNGTVQEGEEVISEVLEEHGYIIDKYTTSTDGSGFSVTFTNGKGYHTLRAATREELIEKINEFAQTNKTMLLG